MPGLRPHHVDCRTSPRPSSWAPGTPGPVSDSPGCTTDGRRGPAGRRRGASTPAAGTVRHREAAAPAFPTPLGLRLAPLGTTARRQPDRCCSRSEPSCWSSPGIAFLAFTWDLLGPFGQITVLLLSVQGALAATARLAARLRGTATALGVVGALLVIDRGHRRPHPRPGPDRGGCLAARRPCHRGGALCRCRVASTAHSCRSVSWPGWSAQSPSWCLLRPPP